MIYVCGPRDQRAPLPPGTVVISTVSKSDEPWRQLSPFTLGPIPLYRGYVARNLENAWQFAKMYACHAGPDGEPTPAYWRWAKQGWADHFAHRYPMGKGAKPLYSLWNGDRLGYIDARRRIYAPLYAAAVRQTEAYARLQQLVAAGSDIGLFDFDGYRADLLPMTMGDVVLNDRRPMGHAFVLKMMLDGNLEASLEAEARSSPAS